MYQIFIWHTILYVLYM